MDFRPRTRVAGTGNFKSKYVPDYPTVTLVETHPGRVMTPEQLEKLGLLVAPEPPAVFPLNPARSHARPAA